MRLFPEDAYSFFDWKFKRISGVSKQLLKHMAVYE
jgi:hypothetical protein